MKQSIKSKARKAVLAAVFIGAPLCLLSKAQFSYQATRLPFGQREALVRASDVVNLSGFVFPPPGGSVAVYMVPADKWLLVTDVETTMPTGVYVDLVEFIGPTSEIKRLYPFSVGPSHPYYHSSVGLAFEPGSTVAFTNVSPSSGTVSYTLTGRLTDV